MADICKLYEKSFGFPVPEFLGNDRVVLEIFNPSRHADRFFSKAVQHPEIWQYIPIGPFGDVDAFKKAFCDPDSDASKWKFTLFAVLDKTKKEDPTLVAGAEEPALAGLIAYLNTVPENLVTEIGAVLILPPFQRTHVASNAVGLLLHYALDAPTDPNPSSLGLRRVVWQANALNKKSVSLAQKLGFRLEGILRWERTLPEGKEMVGNGVTIREGDRFPKRVGRDTALLAICWDEWEEGVREKVDQIVARTQ